MTITESKLKFDFADANWKNIIKYHETKTFKNLTAGIKHTKGVDFIGILEGKSLCIFEVKNFRTPKDGTRPNPDDREMKLEDEIAQKVRDSIIGIASGAKNSTNDKADFQAMIPFFINQKSIQIIFWLEEDEIILKSKFYKKKLDARKNKLKKNSNGCLLMCIF
ncbi:MAG: hypothetical protein ACI9XO_000181 [Paraglaciecola sp.]|jgi:hypothetical protein